jgi:Na+/proline symporter
MSPFLILTCIALYFCCLLIIAYITGKNANQSGYFLGNNKSPWIAVAFGLIGDSLSGVTFISVPGFVGKSNFSYMQVVLGYLVGYIFIANVLLPIFYKLKLTSIYEYLLSRFGAKSQKTGAFYFILSRLLGAAARLYLAAGVLQLFVFNALGVPFWITVAFIIILIYIYTFKGGIKTLVWTDTFQSTFLLLGVILSIIAIKNALNLDFNELYHFIDASPMSNIFVWDRLASNNFFKQFFGGALIAIAMTGLDQNMMQKNLSCNSLKSAQWNIYSFNSILIFINLFFLSLGVLLYAYADKLQIPLPEKTDNLFPMLALNHLGTFAGLAFITGLTAATFSSADSVLTTLTTSFYTDILAKRNTETEASRTMVRGLHIGFAALLLLVIVLFDLLNNQALITTVLTVAGYTYGPLVGLYFFGIFTKFQVQDKWVPLVCILAPILTYLIANIPSKYLGGYQFGFEILAINGILTFLGLLSIRKTHA